MALLPMEQLLYYQILKIGSAIVSHYPQVQDRLLWLIAIPHFIIALFLVFAMGWIAAGHKGLARLGGILIYLFLILGGWYGSWIVPLVNQYFVMLVGAAFILFLISKIFPPAYGPGATGLAVGAAGKIVKATVGRAQNRRTMEKRLEVVERAIAELHRRYPGGAATMPEDASGVYANLLLEREQIRRALE